MVLTMIMLMIIMILSGTYLTRQTSGLARHGGDGDGVHADDTNE